MGVAIFWAIFSQTHLVTLIADKAIFSSRVGTLIARSRRRGILKKQLQVCRLKLHLYQP
jgi:hypothetical protein